MSEEKYVEIEISNLKSVIGFCAAIFCAVVSFLVSEYKSEDPSTFLMISSLVVLSCLFVALMVLILKLNKYMKRIKEL